MIVLDTGLIFLLVDAFIPRRIESRRLLHSFEGSPFPVGTNHLFRNSFHQQDTHTYVMHPQLSLQRVFVASLAAVLGQVP